MSGKSVPKSLFVRKRSPQITDLRTLFKRLVEHTPQRQLNDAISLMLEAAASADVDPGIEQGKRYADDIRDFVALLLDAVRCKDAHMSALWAMRLTQAWMMLRMDAIAAAPVRREQSRTAALVRSKKPSRAFIAAAMASCRTHAAAAKKLGCSNRTLHRWLNKEGLR